jgi:hypothetical protein
MVETGPVADGSNGSKADIDAGQLAAAKAFARL